MAAPAAHARPSQQLFVSDTDAFVSASRLPGSALQHTYLTLYERSKRHGARPGRNILLNGVAIDGGRVRSAKRGELRRSIRVLRRSAALDEHGEPAARGDRRVRVAR